jgi:hypothetical protein
MYHTKTPIQRSMKIVPPDNQNFQGLELVPPNSIQVLIKKPGTGVSEGSGEGKLIRRQTTGNSTQTKVKRLWFEVGRH